MVIITPVFPNKGVVQEIARIPFNWSEKDLFTRKTVLIRDASDVYWKEEHYMFFQSGQNVVAELLEQNMCLGSQPHG